MKRPRWVLPETVHTLHEQLLAEFGGSPGVRDEGLLASALSRPQNFRAYRNPSISDLAASYAFGLVKNHPFVDGNKRIGFATAVLFLEINGARFEAGEVDAVIHMLALAAGELDEPGYSAWHEANMRTTRRRR